MRAPRTSRLLFTAAVCAVLASASAADVRADQTNRERNGNAQPAQSRDSLPVQSREVYERGYREGLRTGENHGRNNRDFNFEREGAYRAGDLGYDQRFGSRDTYRVEFRRGFAAGYRNAYDRFHVVRRDDRWQRRGAPRGFQEPAMARGYSDGYEQGIEDGDDRDRYDPVRHSDYREGDEGYYREYGSRDVYKNNYRTGFRQGYEDGYRNGGRRSVLR